MEDIVELIYKNQKLIRKVCYSFCVNNEDREDLFQEIVYKILRSSDSFEYRSKFSVIWGANNFSDKMPVGGWLVWDKRCGESADRMFGSPFELAWTSRRTTFKFKRLQHGGAVNADGHGVRRVHPTQKPVELMRWCISLFSTARTIVDPYAGSGTTLIADMIEGRKAVGIELDEKYCEVAAARLESWGT